MAIRICPFPHFRKLNQAGFDHVLVAVLCVVAVGVVGTALVVKSHAQTTQWTGRLEVGASSNSGHCLTTSGSGTGSYAEVASCTSTYNAAQVWSVVDTRTINITGEGANGATISGVQEFMIQSADGSNECLNDWQDGGANFTQMRLYPCSSSAAADAWVWQSKVVNASAHQLMNLEASRISLTGARSKSVYNMCLDYASTKGNAGYVYECGSTARTPTPTWQYWWEDAAPAKSSGSGSSTTTWSGALQNGYDRKICMNDNNSSTSSKTAIGIYSCENVTSEKWSIAKNSSGQFVLKNGQGVCADDTGDATQANLETYACNSSDHAQLWAWTASHQIENVYSKSCINDPGSSTTNSTQLTVTSCSGSPASEQWYEAGL